MTPFDVFCQVHSYALLRDVVGALKRPNMEGRQFKHHPLLVMNGFSGDGMHLKLMTTMFQNLFPSINVNTVRTEVPSVLGTVPGPLTRIGRAVICISKSAIEILEHGKVKHQTVLRLTTLLPINFILKLDVLFTI